MACGRPWSWSWPFQEPIHVADFGQYRTAPYAFTPYEPRISDADVERIARRLAALLADRDKAAP